MRKELKCKKTLIDDFRFKITLPLIVSLFSFYEAAPVYNLELQCLAILLKPAECEKIIPHFPPGCLEEKDFLNTTQCFQSLTYWTLNSKLNQKDAYVVLKNRLRQIEKADLFQNCTTRFSRELLEDTIDDWGLNGDKKETTRKLMSIPSSTLSKIDKLLFGPPRLELIPDGSSKNAKDLRPPSGLGDKLKLLMNVSPRLKSHLFVRERANKIANTYPSSPESSPFLRFHPIPREDEQTTHPEMNKAKVQKFVQNVEIGKNDQQHESKLHNFTMKSASLDSSNNTANTYPCLKLNPYVVLGIVSFIVFCTCCCMLILRRKLLGCYHLFRPKKKKKKSSGKYISIDAEGGQRKKKKSFSFKPTKKKSRNSAKTLINTATQDSKASVLKPEKEVPATGCCPCCKNNKKSKTRKK